MADTPQRPPNLRFSDGAKDCSNCRAFKEGSQTCAMFNDWPVSPELVCDDWEANPEKPVTQEPKDDKSRG